MHLEEFERLTDEGARHELEEGELITTPIPKWRHSIVAKSVYDGVAPNVEAAG